MNISHDVLAIVLLEGESFEPGPMGRLVAADRTCRRLAGGIWHAMRLGQVRRLLTAYYDLVTTGFPYGPPPTVAHMLLRMNYVHILLDGPKPLSPLGLRLVEQIEHNPDDVLALSPLRLHLAEQIKRLGLGLAEAVTAGNCGNILLEIDASTPELSITDDSDAASTTSYDTDAPADDADIETWSAYWQTLARPYG